MLAPSISFSSAHVIGAATGAPGRAQFLRWQVYLATALYMSDLRLFYPERYTLKPGEAEGIKARALETMMQEFAIYADALGEGPFILGQRMCGGARLARSEIREGLRTFVSLFRTERRSDLVKFGYALALRPDAWGEVRIARR